MRSRTCAVWLTPSAAVGSSRISSLASQSVARATATAWRWPPESEPTRSRRLSIVVTAGRACARPRAPPSRARRAPASRRAPSRACRAPGRGRGSRRCRGCRTARGPGRRSRSRGGWRRSACGWRPRGPRSGSAAVGRLRAGDGLDQRRLAGAVVAHEGDDLARVDLEVHVDERLDGSEALADPGALEQRDPGSGSAAFGGVRAVGDGHGQTVPREPRPRIGAPPPSCAVGLPTRGP